MAKRGRGKAKGPALKAWLGDASGSEEAAGDEGAPPEAGAAADADGSGDAPAGDVTGGAAEAEATPDEEPENAEASEGEGDEGKPDEPKPPPKDEPKERLSTAWANVKRERKAVKRDREELTSWAQRVEQARADAEKAQAEARALVERAKANPLAFAQEHGIAARQLLEAAAKEEDKPAGEKKAEGLEALIKDLQAEIRELKEGRQKEQTAADERQELAELARFLDDPPEGVDVSAIQWWGAEEVAADLHRAWVEAGRPKDLISRIESANLFFAERLARARPSTSEAQAAPAAGPPERGNGAGQPAEPAAAAKQPPPALSNATARRPSSGTAPRTRAERKAAAVALLDTR